MAAANAKRKENILFHLQQAAEKALTAVLCARGLPVPLVHNLPIINDRFGNEVIPYADEVADWGQFAALRRYEEGVSEIEVEDIAGALTIAEKILDWSIHQVKASTPSFCV